MPTSSRPATTNQIAPVMALTNAPTRPWPPELSRFVRHARPLSWRLATSYAAPTVPDYDECRGPLMGYWKSQNGEQMGDPAKLARSLLVIASQAPPPRRFIAGVGAIAGAEQKIAELREDIESNRAPSTSLAFDA